MKIKLILIFILFFIFNLPASDEERLNTLPLGPSKFKNFLSTIGNKQIIETSSGKVVSISDMIEKNKNTDIFIIGEFHNSYSCHEFQRDFIEALVKTYPKIIVGFEFFKRIDDVVLEQWRKGEISEKELIEKTGWYRSKSFNYGYTKIIMDVIKKHRINAIGLNIPRKIVRRVSTRGFNSLSEQEKKLFPGINTPSIEHKYYIKSIFGKPAVQSEKWFENVYSAQKCWDIVMAESMTKIL